MNKSIELPTRRRAISIIAAASAAPLLGAKLVPSPSPVFREWVGQALGAQSRIVLSGSSAADIKGALSGLLSEIDRLESCFSLFRPESELSRLNRDGHLENPSLEMRTVLLEAKRIHLITGGAFDVSVQPLWLALAKGSAQQNGAQKDTKQRINAAERLVDSNAIEVSPHRVTLMKKGMGITLNGIAQGYITDQVAAQLRQRGFSQTLVQLGETVALEAPQSQAGWQIGLKHKGSRDPDHFIGIENAAVATSDASALHVNELAGVDHIIPPNASWRQQKVPSQQITAVSVVASNATLADGLSTALSVMPLSKHVETIAKSDAHYAIVSLKSGALAKVTSSGIQSLRGDL